ncbi:MAG: hypothetical protein AABX65_03475 [Nanoarchaeota archaeon]
MADESSGIVLNKTFNVELRNALIEINTDKEFLSALFEVYSNEDKIQKTRVYLKAKGQYCYNGCRDMDVVEHSTSFNINNNLDFGVVDSSSKGVSAFAKVYETKEGNFAGVEFELLPKQINTIKVFQSITLPFHYYLDSLSAFSKADHEKITIRGGGSRVSFNDKYPVKKISDNEWVWEYSNINTEDQNLKDVLVISKGYLPEPAPKKSFFQKIIDWFRNLF